MREQVRKEASKSVEDLSLCIFFSREVNPWNKFVYLFFSASEWDTFLYVLFHQASQSLERLSVYIIFQWVSQSEEQFLVYIFQHIRH